MGSLARPPCGPGSRLLGRGRRAANTGTHTPPVAGATTSSPVGASYADPTFAPQRAASRLSLAPLFDRRHASLLVPCCVGTLTPRLYRRAAVPPGLGKETLWPGRGAVQAHLLLVFAIFPIYPWLRCGHGGAVPCRPPPVRFVLTTRGFVVFLSLRVRHCLTAPGKKKRGCAGILSGARWSNNAFRLCLLHLPSAPNGQRCALQVARSSAPQGSMPRGSERTATDGAVVKTCVGRRVREQQHRVHRECGAGQGPRHSYEEHGEEGGVLLGVGRCSVACKHL